MYTHRLRTVVSYFVENVRAQVDDRALCLIESRLEVVFVQSSWTIGGFSLALNLPFSQEPLDVGQERLAGFIVTLGQKMDGHGSRRIACRGHRTRPESWQQQAKYTVTSFTFSVVKFVQRFIRTMPTTPADQLLFISKKK
jgi:hypothetical protein